MCGLPRAGNTLFSSIMNQNPNVSVTANSLNCELFTYPQFLKENFVYKNYEDSESLDNITKGILPNYYGHWKADHIIDRAPWGMSPHFDILKEFAPNDVKVIVPVRDLKEIIASYIKFSYSTDTNYIAMNANTLDERCDLVMEVGHNFQIWLECVKNLCKDENRKFCYFMEYDNLVNNPKNEIDKIYQFLDIEQFEHRFTNLSQLENNGIQYNDSIFGGDLHKVKENKVEKSDYDIYDYLPKDVDSRYKLDKFW